MRLALKPRAKISGFMRLVQILDFDASNSLSNSACFWLYPGCSYYR
ncbi:hypothetical protein TREAZ_0106 [Leadbettera azotonutricia ZAS-9]|uniref:Uncharacterized protein n=1 Tax=Leadbettera azotonutricia (strain ATCC BAA-888 / DSM 13862 / ZAS-9) TaxID=545695 RepID=F5YFH1_LEAAZ|nr:hypothetical protein TREAZ_0106 [Leadbettera azotonutricia ZAS-9]